MPTRYAEELRRVTDAISSRSCAYVCIEADRACGMRFLDELSARGISIGSNGQCGNHMTITVAPDDVPAVQEAARGVCCAVQIVPGLMEITIEGSAFPETPGVLAKVYHALDVFNGVPLLVGSPTTITVIVPEEEGNVALPRLKAAFGFDAPTT